MSCRTAQVAALQAAAAVRAEGARDAAALSEHLQRQAQTDLEHAGRLSAVLAAVLRKVVPEWAERATLAGLGAATPSDATAAASHALLQRVDVAAAAAFCETAAAAQILAHPPLHAARAPVEADAGGSAGGQSLSGLMTDLDQLQHQLEGWQARAAQAAVGSPAHAPHERAAADAPPRAAAGAQACRPPMHASGRAPTRRAAHGPAQRAAPAAQPASKSTAQRCALQAVQTRTCEAAAPRAAAEPAPQAAQLHSPAALRAALPPSGRSSPCPLELPFSEGAYTRACSPARSGRSERSDGTSPRSPPAWPRSPDIVWPSSPLRPSPQRSPPCSGASAAPAALRCPDAAPLLLSPGGASDAWGRRAVEVTVRRSDSASDSPGRGDGAALRHGSVTLHDAWLADVPPGSSRAAHVDASAVQRGGGDMRPSAWDGAGEAAARPQRGAARVHGAEWDAAALEDLILSNDLALAHGLVMGDSRGAGRVAAEVPAAAVDRLISADARGSLPFASPRHAGGDCARRELPQPPPSGGEQFPATGALGFPRRLRARCSWFSAPAGPGTRAGPSQPCEGLGQAAPSHPRAAREAKRSLDFAHASPVRPAGGLEALRARREAQHRAALALSGEGGCAPPHDASAPARAMQAAVTRSAAALAAGQLAWGDGGATPCAPPATMQGEGC